MPKKPSSSQEATTPPGKLAGKTFAFAGKFGYGFDDRAQKLVTAEGGTIAKDVTGALDYIVAGQGRGGALPRDVAKAQKRNPAVQVLNEADFYQLFVPARDDLLGEMAAGTMDHDRWEQTEYVLLRSGMTVDLSGADLRNAKLSGAKLHSSDMTGADFRGADLSFAELGAQAATRFDGAKMHAAKVEGGEDCSFVEADLSEGWFFSVHRYVYKPFVRCDFTAAKLTQIHGDKTKAADCIFRRVDLSRAEVEEADFSGADFTEANLTCAHLHKSNLSRGNFGKAILFRADLRETNLAGADLRSANLRGAVLCEADLTGAQIDGADFTGANLAGAKVAGIDSSKAKGFQSRPARQPGPNMRELAKVASKSKQLTSTAELDIGDGDYVILMIDDDLRGGQHYVDASARQLVDGSARGHCDMFRGTTFVQAMLQAAERWAIGKLRLDSIKVSAKGCALRAKELQALATAAWLEACGLEVPDEEKLQEQKESLKADKDQRRAAMLAELRGGTAGLKKWHARPKRQRETAGPFSGADLAGKSLQQVDLEKVDLRGVCFDGARLAGARLKHCRLEKASFVMADLGAGKLDHVQCSGVSFAGANLSGASLRAATLRNGNFTGARFHGADLSFADLRGADLATAKLGRTKFDHASFDHETHFPPGFKLAETMIWRGTGPDPRTIVIDETPEEKGPMTFEAFFKKLGNNIDFARLEKALAMLKAERFSLFAEMKDDAVVGVVRSQSNKELVYSCRLAKDGNFSCCTQNLKPCGGLRGSLCKHLLVLIVGLTKAGDLDSAIADTWVKASRKKKPAIDQELMSETFLRYKGAEAGTVDWRPTETVPEDYYAL